MGNIRQLQIKNTAKRLLEIHENKFVEKDFEHNKKMVSELTENLENEIRNRIAGYITKILSPLKKRRGVVNYELYFW